MHLIDRYAYATKARYVTPAQKAALALAVIGLCLGLNTPAVGLTATAEMVLLVVLWAGHAPAVMLRVLLAEAAFLALVVVGVAVSLSLTPRSAALAVRLGPVWLNSDAPQVQEALRLLTRALGSVAAMNFLALTTPMVDLIDLLRRVRVPVLLLDMMTVTYRFIFTLLESMERMYVAQASRLGYATWWRGMRSAALLGSRLFLDAYQRNRRLHIALEARGYQGDLRVLPGTYTRDRSLLAWGVFILSSLVLVWRVV